MAFITTDRRKRVYQRSRVDLVLLEKWIHFWVVLLRNVTSLSLSSLSFCLLSSSLILFFRLCVFVLLVFCYVMLRPSLFSPLVCFLHPSFCSVLVCVFVHTADKNRVWKPLWFCFVYLILLCGCVSVFQPKLTSVILGIIIIDKH
jgi:hypothetical protein